MASGAALTFTGLLLSAVLSLSGGSCVFPSGLRGNFTSNKLSAADVTINDTHIIGFTPYNQSHTCKYTQCGQKFENVTLSFECLENNGSRYLLQSTQYRPFANNIIFFRLYVCLYLTRLSDDKFVFYQGPNDFDSFWGDYVKPSIVSSTPAMGAVCNLPRPLPANKFHLLIRQGTVTSQSNTCPDDLLGTFVSQNVTLSCATELNVCPRNARDKIFINDTSCSTNSFFAPGGNISCLYSLSQNDVTYMITYSLDNTTLSFACMMFIKNGGIIYVNQYDRVCESYKPLLPKPVDLPVPNNTSFNFSMSPTAFCPFPCALPSTLNGTWVSSKKGAVTFTNTTLSNFPSCGSGSCTNSTPEVLECYRIDGSNYLLRSPVMTINNENVRVYVCLKLSKVSSSKYIYYQLHQDADATRGDYVAIYNAAQSPSPALVCDDLSDYPYVATRLNLFVKSGTELESLTSCPSYLAAQFNNTDNACDSKFSVCGDPNVINVIGTACSPIPFYSGSGTLGCMYNMTVNDTTYLTLYNYGDAVNSNNGTFDFTCVAMSLNGTTLQLSQNPLECADSQTATAINSTSGKTFTYERTDGCPVPEPFDPTLIIIIVCAIIGLLLLILLIVLIICCCRCKRRRERQRKEEEEKRKILEEEDGRYLGSGTQSRVGVGTAKSHFQEDEDGPKQAPVATLRRRHHPRRRGRRIPGKDGDHRYETDTEGAEYSDDSQWEEGSQYLDEDGNPIPGRRGRRRRRRKKVKRKYTKTTVLEDGRVIEEEVESEYSVTASSDVTSSSEEAYDITDELRAARLRRKLGPEMFINPVFHDAAIITRPMDEKQQQPDGQSPKRLSFLQRLKQKVRNRKSKSKVRKRGYQEGGVVMQDGNGKKRRAAITPYMHQYEAKKQIESTLNNEGYFDDPADKMTADAIFGFGYAERVLSPQQNGGDLDRMTSASDSSQSRERSSSRDHSSSRDRSGSRDRSESRVNSPPRGLGHGDASRKDSDTSSGVADLNGDPHTPETQGEPGFHDPRNVSVQWDKANNLYARIQEINSRDEEEGTTSRENGRRSRRERDKARVKTALRKLLNERLFGINNEKIAKSKTQNGANGNNVVTTPVNGTRGSTRSKVRPVTQGKVAFIDSGDDHNLADDKNTLGRSGVGPQQGPGSKHSAHSDDNSGSSSSKSRLPTRGGSMLPPLRACALPTSRIHTPAHFPKWGIYVTASQRNALTEGLQRDRTFLSRMSRRGVESAWTSGDDGLYPYRSETSGETMSLEDETQYDPHRPDIVHISGTGNGTGDQGRWADRPSGRGAQNGDGRLAYTNSSGRPFNMDDWRLRKLLEELYRDKKFMDKLINEIDADHLEFPDTVAAEDVKLLSELGRDYLLERAAYWDQHGPLGPPRPPTTALGMRLERSRTAMTSQDTSVDTFNSKKASSPRPKTVR